MGIQNIHDLKPGDDPDYNSTLSVGFPNANGEFTISGPDSVVTVISSTRFTVHSPFVTSNGDGSYTAKNG